MQSGALIESPVRSFTSRITVSGVNRPFASWDTSGDIVGDLPEQAVSGAGVRQQQGTVVWAAQDAVTVGEVSPWGRRSAWPPAAGEPVVIYASDGVSEWAQFTGKIDSSSGGSGAPVTSTVIDGIDRLNTPLSVNSLLRVMPPATPGGEFRGVGLDHWWMVTTALRRVGLCNTPPDEALGVVSAPLQGSVWPEIGDMFAAAPASPPFAHPRFFSALWGESMSNAALSYTPSFARTLSEPLQVTLMVAPDHAGVTTADTMFGLSRVRLRVDETRGVQAILGTTTACELTPAQMSGAVTVSLLVKGSSWVMRNDAGAEATGTLSTTAVTDLMSRVVLNADDASRVAGLQVSSPSSVIHEFASLSFVPTARFLKSAIVTSMDATPTITNRTVRDVVDEISSATLTPMWFDEAGTWQMIPSDILANRAPVQTIDTLDDIFSLQWEENLLSVRSTVSVEWLDPAISSYRNASATLYEDSGDTFDSGESQEIFIKEPTDEAWIGVDTVLSRNIYGTDSTFNKGHGSFIGAVLVDEESEIATTDFTATLTRISADTLKLKITAPTLPAGKTLAIRTLQDSASIWSMRRGKGLPVIRGMARVVFGDIRTQSTIVGPSGFPALTHTLGVWGGEYDAGGSAAKNLADFIAGYVTKPSATVKGVRVQYDPRRQLGDVYNLNSNLFGISLTVLVVGLSRGFDGGHPHQKLELRIIDATSTRKVSYAELVEAWGGGNYTALNTVWAGLAYNDLISDPLEGAPNT